MLPSGTLCELVESLNRRLHFGIPGSHGVIESVKEFILLSCLKGPACLGTSRKTDKVRYVMVWFEFFFCKCVSVCERSKELVRNETNRTIETEALGSFRCCSLQLHRSWPVHRRRLRTGCAAPAPGILRSATTLRPRRRALNYYE